VAPKDARSNYRLVQLALLNRLDPAAWPDVRRIRGELGLPDAVDDYERRLHDRRGVRSGNPARTHVLASMVAPLAGEVTVLLDAAAASLL
jgi:hypothetical protein